MMLGDATRQRIFPKRNGIDRLKVVLEHSHIRFDGIQIVIQAADQLLFGAPNETQCRYVFGPNETAPAQIVLLREWHHEKGAECQITIAGALKVVDEQQVEILEGNGT